MSEKALRDGLHPGVRYAVEIYCCGVDVPEVEVCMRVATAAPLPALKRDISLEELLASFGQGLPAIDGGWRFMTDAEIKAYRAREEGE